MRLYHRLKLFFQNVKYRNKLWIVCLACGILPLIIIGSFMFCGFRNILVEKEYESMDIALSQIADAVEQQVEITDNLMNYFVYNHDLADMVSSPQMADYNTYNTYANVVDPLLVVPKYYHKAITRVTIYSDQVVIPHDVTIAPLSELQDKPWYDTLSLTSDTLWVWPDAYRREILALKRFPGYLAGEAYLGIYCDLDTMMTPISSFQKDGAGVILYDETGTLLYAYRSDGKDISGLIPETIRETYQYREKAISDLPLMLCVYMEQSAIYASFYNMSYKIVLLVLLCLIAIVAVSTYTSYLLVRRIQGLTDIVEHMDVGNTQVDIVDDSEDEIGILIRSFKTSMDEIHRLVNEVYKSKITQQELEMKALQAQINPHFLYNSLSLINWMALDADEEDISQITLALSDYYRTTLNKGENFITIKGEVLNIQSYIMIQLLMHDYEFDVEYDIGQGLDDYCMPKLILQPLVENALEHGLDVKEDPDKHLYISCQADGDDIVWSVRDNGVGMDAETLEDLNQKHKSGYGVRNVFSRLVLLYGEAYGPDITSEPGVGTTVRVRIPKESNAYD